jgi:hypothetical protein
MRKITLRAVFGSLMFCVGLAVADPLCVPAFDTSFTEHVQQMVNENLSKLDEAAITAKLYELEQNGGLEDFIEELNETDVLASSDASATDGVEPQWGNAAGQAGAWNVLTLGALPGNYITVKGLVVINANHKYFVWASKDQAQQISALMFTRLIGSTRLGFKGSAIDVLWACQGPNCEISEPRMTVRSATIPNIVWLQKNFPNSRELWHITWNTNNWGRMDGVASPEAVHITYYSPIVNSGDVAINTWSDLPGIFYVDSGRKAWFREWNPSYQQWLGHGGSIADQVYYESTWTAINRCALIYDSNAQPHGAWCGETNGNANFVRRRYYGQYTAVWQGKYGSIDTLPCKAKAYIATNFDSWGRFLVTGHWEAATFNRVWFTMATASGWKSASGNGSYDWVYLPNGYFPMVAPRLTDNYPFVIFFDQQKSHAAISYWHWYGFDGYGGTGPSNVGGVFATFWGLAMGFDWQSREHIALGICTQPSPTCQYSEIRYRKRL